MQENNSEEVQGQGEPEEEQRPAAADELARAGSGEAAPVDETQPGLEGETDEEAAAAAGQSAEEQADEQQSSAASSEESPQAELPPQAQGEVNGGPLGCCLGVMIGLLLSLVIAVVARLAGDTLIHVLGGALLANVRLIMGCVAAILALGGGILGWKIGYRIYREYELSPRQKRKLAELERKQIEKLKRKQRR